MFIAIHKLVNVPDGHRGFEAAGHRARRGAAGRNSLCDREIPSAPRRWSAFSGEIPADHLLVKSHADAIRQLRVQERTQQRVGGQLLSSAREHVVETEFPAGLSVE